MLEFLILFLSIYFWGSPVGLSVFWGHFGAFLISLFSLKNLYSSFIFWLLLVLVIITAQEKRLSLEYFLLASSFFLLGADSSWNGDKTNSFEKRKKILFGIFTLIVITNLLHFELSERGSLLLWIPVFLALYFKPLNKKNFLIYLLFGICLFLSNKLAAFIAVVFCMRSVLVYGFSVVLFFIYFLLKQDLGDFLIKSFEPRLYIMKSSFFGFIDKSLFGHGFGTFALDFPKYRFHADVLGGRISEQVVHGHSLFNHFAFEMGIVGLLLIAGLLYLLFINAKQALLPFLVISLCDCPLFCFNQYLLCGLLFIPFIKQFGILERFFVPVSNMFLKSGFFLTGLFIMFVIYIQSLFGHYYYDSGDLDNAIKWDRYNSLYHFTRGANLLSTNSVQSETDLLKSVELAPSVSYFYGFLGAAQLANNKITDAKRSLEKAIKLDGQDGYWCLLYSYANYDNEAKFKKYQNLAFKKNPEIRRLLFNPNIPTPRFIGYSRFGDVRLAGFYRSGEKIYFPLPVLKK